MMNRFLFLSSCCLLSLSLTRVSSFQTTRQLLRVPLHDQIITSSSTELSAAKKKPKKKKGGTTTTTTIAGGFGAAPTQPKEITTISADKGSLERQWDTFTSITDLEITPPSPDDDFFEVVDVFVRCNVNGVDKWFRIGKACTSAEKETSGDDDDSSSAHSNINAALTLHKGLIFWTAVHMRRELVAAGGKSGAASLELGYTKASMTTGSDVDGPVEDEDVEHITVAERVSVKDVSIKTIGFRPDWNPPGFTYKRREKAAMKKKKKVSTLEDIALMEEE